MNEFVESQGNRKNLDLCFPGDFFYTLGGDKNRNKLGLIEMGLSSAAEPKQVL